MYCSISICVQDVTDYGLVTVHIFKLIAVELCVLQFVSIIPQSTIITDANEHIK